MKKRFVFLVMTFIFAVLIGCGCGIKKELDDSAKKAESISAAMQKKSENEESEEKSKEKVVFDVVPYDICFTFSDDWENTTDDSPFDLQMKRDDRYYCSIFGFKDIDLSNGMVPEDIFELQKEDLFGKRDFVELVKKEPVWENEKKKIYRELYSGELEGEKYYYYCCLIDFKEPAEGLAWVIFSGGPSWIENDIQDLDEILMTAEDTGVSTNDEVVGENEI